MIANSNPRQPAPASLRAPFIPTPFRWLTLLLLWIAAWTFFFSAVDFWTIKLYDAGNWKWFQEYRAVMRYGLAWVSPPSFALAENAYFLWMNTYDGGYTMHEWHFYKGNPWNPDGKFNFVWGDNHGGWIKFPMSEWYSWWLLPTIPWLALVTWRFGRRPYVLPGERTAGWLVRLVLKPQLSDTE